MNPTQTNISNADTPDGVTPNIVGNIPVHGDPSAAGNEDTEMDKLMHDVGQQLKQEDKKPVKKHLFFKRKHRKTEPKFSAQPLLGISAQAQPTPEPQPEIKAQTVSKKPDAPTQSEHKPTPNPKTDIKLNPQNHKSAPTFVITVVVIVTGVLIIFAVAAYKQ